MKVMNYKSLVKEIDKMEKGNEFWVNTINFSERSIIALRNFIQTGLICPDEEELKRSIAEKYLEDFRSGKRILPQMLYVKL